MMIIMHQMIHYLLLCAVVCESHNFIMLLVKYLGIFLFFAFGNASYIIPTATNRTISSNHFVYNRIPKSGSTTTSKIIEELAHMNRRFSYIGKTFIIFKIQNKNSFIFI